MWIVNTLSNAQTKKRNIRIVTQVQMAKRQQNKINCYFSVCNSLHAYACILYTWIASYSLLAVLILIISYLHNCLSASPIRIAVNITEFTELKFCMYEVFFAQFAYNAGLLFIWFIFSVSGCGNQLCNIRWIHFFRSLVVGRCRRQRASYFILKSKITYKSVDLWIFLKFIRWNWTGKTEHSKHKNALLYWLFITRNGWIEFRMRAFFSTPLLSLEKTRTLIHFSLWNCVHKSGWMLHGFVFSGMEYCICNKNAIERWVNGCNSIRWQFKRILSKNYWMKSN